MRIGLDLSVIQTPHRMRGIGAVAIHFVKNIPKNYKKDDVFVLYLYEEGQDEALSILDLEGLAYEVKNILKEERVKLNIPRRLAIFESILTNLREKIYSTVGDPRIKDTDNLDVFLQFDQMQNIPKLRKVKTGVILYDLIPYIMEADYLWTYKTARRNRKSRRGSLRMAYLRKKYISQARSVAKRADMLFAISEHTKNDFVKYAGISKSKIEVIHLGVDEGQIESARKNLPFERYVENSWGSFPKPIDLHKKPFLLFVGGADARRKLIDLVAAYNNLKAQDYDIRLVLAGDIMTGPSAIPVVNVQQYITESSYFDDIVFLGFVTDEQKEWLYSNAVAMVYPSVYEGFGLPILEAMRYGTPVITYKNSSIPEVAGNAAIYAEDFKDIATYIKQLIDKPRLVKKYNSLGEKQAAKFSWGKTSQRILGLLNS